MSKLWVIAGVMLLALGTQTSGYLFGQPAGLRSFALKQVTLLPGPFRAAQQTDLNYILALDPDRLLAPFRREAGLPTRAPSYGNWENSGLDGHIGGHYLSALSLMYAATQDERVGQRLQYMLDELERCQQQHDNGYIGGIPQGVALWREVAGGDIRAEWFSLNDRWVPLYNIHKLFAGLLDAYTHTGNEQALRMLRRLGTWFYQLTDAFTDPQLQQLLRSEHGGLNEVFAELSAITGEQRFLTLARRLSHRLILDPLLRGEDQLTGLHANTQIPKVVGFQRIAALSGDSSWARAADFFWHTVTQHRSVAIGGNSVREHFHPADDFSSMIEDREGPETCNTYNMLRLSRGLWLARPRGKYLDYYERALYNHILSSQHPDGGFVYFTPMRPRHYRVYSQPQQGFWCCVGSGLENHGKYGELIYAHRQGELFINLFIPSRLRWPARGLELIQQTDFPYSEYSNIRLKLTTARRFALYLRSPSWLAAPLEVSVNGRIVAASHTTDGYLKIARRWKDGDELQLRLPMRTRAEFLPDGSPWFAFVHGPVVLAAATGRKDMPGLRADSSRMGHIAAGPLYPVDEAAMVIAPDSGFVAELQPVPDQPLTFRAGGILRAANGEGLQLEPFYRLHDTRYQLYWRYASPEQYEAIVADLQQREAQRLALEAQTIDQVAPGQQQPESDHAFRGERTEQGIHRNRHWRAARGWFSYTLNNSSGAGQRLRITYFGRDRDRAFDILINDRLLQTVYLTGEGGDSFIDVDYELPADHARTHGPLTVKFVAHEGSTAGGIYYLRLLR